MENEYINIITGIFTYSFGMIILLYNKNISFSDILGLSLCFAGIFIMNSVISKLYYNKSEGIEK
jgi:hypothetical protein